MKENSRFDKKSLKLVQGKTANFGELAKDCVAFANSNGGVISIGIEDEYDLPNSNQEITETLPEKIVKRINELTFNVALRTEVVVAENGGQYINLHIFPSHVSIASTTKGQYFIRDYDSSRVLLPDELSRLISDRPSYNWETKVTLNIHWEKADEQKLRDFFVDVRSSDRVSDFIKEKTETEILSYYQMIDESGLLTNLGVLWLGKAAQRARLLYSPIVQYIKYDAREEKIDKKVWDDYRFNPKELIETIRESIPEWKEFNEVSEGLWRKNLPAYDEKVVRELLCNAIVHRPYTTRGDIFIKLFPDHMSITNPGLLPIGVTVDNILQKTEKRNLHLAKVFYDLHLMESEGTGYDLLYETLLMAGKKKPVVVEGNDFVEVSVERSIITKGASRIYDFVSDHYKLSRKNYICLGIVLQHRTISAVDLSKELQLPQGERLRSWVEALLTNRIVESRGTGKGVKYSINPEFVANSMAQFTTSLRTIEPYRLKALIKEDLRFHPYSLLAEIGRRLPDVDFSELEKMTRDMAAAGELKTSGGRRYRKYALPEILSFKERQKKE